MRMSARAGAYTPPPASASFIVSLYDTADPGDTPLAQFTATVGSTVYVDVAALVSYDWILDDCSVVTTDDGNYTELEYTILSQSEVEFVMPAVNVAVWVKQLW